MLCKYLIFQSLHTTNLRYSSDGSRPVSPIPAAGGTTPSIAGAIDQFLASTDLAEQPPAQTDLPPTDDHPEANQNVESVENNENQNAEQTTLLQNEEESFALAPVDASALRGSCGLLNIA